MRHPLAFTSPIMPPIHTPPYGLPTAPPIVYVVYVPMPAPARAHRSHGRRRHHGHRHGVGAGLVRGAFRGLLRAVEGMGR